MGIPWLRVVDAALGFTEVARRLRRGRSTAIGPDDEGAEVRPLESRLAGVVVAALKETFDRDHQRLALERERLDADRAGALRAERLALVRQSADRELGRLRWLAGIAVAGWIVPLVLIGVFEDGGVASRVALGAGWLLLVAAIAAALAGQVEVSRALDGIVHRITRDEGGAVTSETFVTGSGTLASSLIVAGLAAIALGALLA
jgi:hypothetical protein